MSITLYNTLSRTKEPFTPIDSDNVRMYVCGPTVYDYAHIGNARPAIVFDVLYRLLRHTYGDANVTYVRNITDVDDKIIARAKRDFPDLDLNEAIGKVTAETEAQYREDMRALGCLEPTHEPRATENIPQMVEIVSQLLASGNAYET
jgi:cysteinyl-tRNA synthetase